MRSGQPRKKCRSQERNTCGAESSNSSLLSSCFLLAFVELVNRLLRSLNNLQDVSWARSYRCSFCTPGRFGGRRFGRGRKQLVNVGGMKIHWGFVVAVAHAELVGALRRRQLHALRR